MSAFNIGETDMSWRYQDSRHDDSRNIEEVVLHHVLMLCHINEISHSYETTYTVIKIWCYRGLMDMAPGPLARYVKLRVAHTLGMPGTFSPPPRVSDPDMHHGTCVTHVPSCMPGSLTSGIRWSRWRGKRTRHSRRMHDPQFYLSGKRPMREMK